MYISYFQQGTHTVQYEKNYGMFTSVFLYGIIPDCFVVIRVVILLSCYLEVESCFGLLYAMGALACCTVYYGNLVVPRGLEDVIYIAGGKESC